MKNARIELNQFELGAMYDAVNDKICTLHNKDESEWLLDLLRNVNSKLYAAEKRAKR